MAIALCTPHEVHELITRKRSPREIELLDGCDPDAACDGHDTHRLLLTGCALLARDTTCTELPTLPQRGTQKASVC